jgi:hypothetical protein
MSYRLSSNEAISKKRHHEMKLEVKLINEFGISHFYLFIKTFIRERSFPFSALGNGTVFPRLKKEGERRTQALLITYEA